MHQPIKYLEGTCVDLRPMEADDTEWAYATLNGDVEGRRLTGSPTACSREQVAAGGRHFRG